MIEITEVYMNMTDAQSWAFRRVMDVGRIYARTDNDMYKCCRKLHTLRFGRIGWYKHSHSITYSELELFFQLCEELKRVKPDEKELRTAEVKDILECYEKCKSFMAERLTEKKNETVRV